MPAEIGYHVNNILPAVAPTFRRAKPRIALSMDHNPEFWSGLKQELRDQGVNLFLIGRQYFSHQDPRGEAKPYCETILPLAERMRGIYDAWMYLCEVAGDNWDDLRWYNQRSVEFAETMHTNGHKVVCGNFAVGNPTAADQSMWDEYVDAVAASDYIGLHEYDWPALWSLHRESEAQNGGRWKVLRYRRVQERLRAICAARGWPESRLLKPIIITELGIDKGADYVGWRSTCSPQEYVQQLDWYASEMRKDGVRGVIYCCGAIDDRWRDFDVAGVDEIADWMASYPTAEPAPTPQPQPGGNMYTTIGNGYQVIDRRSDLLRSGAYPRRDLGLVKWIAIHHSGTPGDCSAESIARYHVQTNGWPGAGYHLLVHPDGRTEMMNDLDRACFNVAYRNAETIGVCLAGDFSQAPPPAAQLAATKRLVAELQFALGWFCPAVGHGEIADPRSPSACPGATWPQWKAAVQVVPPAPTAPAYRYVLGFSDLAGRLGADVVGAPTENEQRVSLMRQRTEHGVMLYEDGGQPMFYRGPV